MNYTAEFFNELAKDVNAKENRKWWYNQDGTEIVNPDKRLLTLVVSEIIEAFEGSRKNLKDDKLPHRDMIEVELADAVLRLLDRMIGKNLSPFNKNYKYTRRNEEFYEFAYDIIASITNNNGNTSTQNLVYYILDIGYSMGYDVIAALEEKREYNVNRADHSYESRNGVNGKKF